MSLLKALLNIAFGTAKNHAATPEIRFYKQSNPFTSHGRLIVSHADHGLNKQAVRFSFIELNDAPDLDAEMFHHIWESARKQGYTPHNLESYALPGNVNSVEYPAETVTVKSRHAGANGQSGKNVYAIDTPERFEHSDYDLAGQLDLESGIHFPASGRKVTPLIVAELFTKLRVGSGPQHGLQGEEIPAFLRKHESQVKTSQTDSKSAFKR